MSENHRDVFVGMDQDAQFVRDLEKANKDTSGLKLEVMREVGLPPIVFQNATEDLWEAHARSIEELKQAHARIEIGRAHV